MCFTAMFVNEFCISSLVSLQVMTCLTDSNIQGIACKENSIVQVPACQSANAPDQELKTVTNLFASCDARPARVPTHVRGLVVTGKENGGRTWNVTFVNEGRRRIVDYYD
jgi:hypothetical protein